MRVDAEGLPALQLEDIQEESEAQLHARGIAYSREYARVEGQATVLLKNLATVILAIRRRHDDWLGRTHEYRQEVAEMYRAAGLADAQLTRTQNSVRYHVGNLLRQTLTPRQLQRLELLDTSPLERLQDARATNAAILKATKASADAATSTPKPAKSGGRKPAKGKAAAEAPAEAGLAVKATADHLRLAVVAHNIVSQLDTGVVTRDMTDGQRAKLDEELAALQKEITALRRLTRKPKSAT
ncbi:MULTISPECIES: hypothetical protein [unclassified Streptomyces]|uniref:hypothetical protein n=1 Tax=unclassified Streptomyces TaxID=2593676 RepID=UPI0036E353AB